MAESRVRTGEAQGEPELVSCPKSEEMFQKWQDIIKGTQMEDRGSSFRCRFPDETTGPFLLGDAPGSTELKPHLLVFPKPHLLVFPSTL